MELRHGRWPWLHRGRLMHWIIGALCASWIYTGRNSLPTTRYAPALGSHFYPTLFAAAVCHSLDISFAPTLGRIITELFMPALWTLLAIGDGGLVAPDNLGSEPWRLTCGQSRTSDGETTRPGQIGMAATCGNGYTSSTSFWRRRLYYRPIAKRMVT